MRPLLVLACIAGGVTVAWMYRQPGDVQAVVTSDILVSQVKPFGVNLGNWTFWGAEQLSSNVIKNPGFEGLIDGAIVIPTHNSQDTFNDSPDWLGRNDGFWENASYSIRAGDNAGKQGRIVHSLLKGPGGLPAFTVRRGDPVPDFGSVAAVVKDTEDKLPSEWWFSKGTGNSFAPAQGQTRPGSPGARSLKIGAAGDDYAEVASYFDTIATRAGKMLPFDGPWTLTFWARVADGGASLKVILKRDGSVPFLSADVPLTTDWKKVELSFNGKDDGAPDTVSLRLQVRGKPVGHILLDDIDLRKNKDTGKPFRSDVVDVLRNLHPAYLRDWQGQLGDTLENRIAPAFARKSYRYRPGPQDSQTDYGYGIGDLIELSKDVGAAPWIIIPPTFTDDECAGFGDYLSKQNFTAGQKPFLEFANESWNDLFRPGGIPDPYMYSQAADRCFAAIRSHAGAGAFRTVIGTQFANPAAVSSYANESHGADVIAVAPYFAYSVPAGLSVEHRIPLLFEPQSQKLIQELNTAKTLKKELAIYEINSHASDGKASGAERLPLVAGLASGSALARNMLDALSEGVRNQCVYTLSGYDTGLTAGKDYAPLWGIVRDLGSTRRFRPTGLALEMMNAVLRGDMMHVMRKGPSDVSIYALSEGPSIIAVSGSSASRKVTVQIHAARPFHLFRLNAPSLSSTNENGEDVKITSEPVTRGGDAVSFTLPPFSIAILTTKETLAP